MAPGGECRAGKNRGVKPREMDDEMRLNSRREEQKSY